MWYVLVFFLGIVLGAAETLLMIGVGDSKREQEAYKEGYEDGTANANKNKEV
jgi:hypothetical protein